MKKRRMKKRIKQLEAELEIMNGVVPMTDAQRKAFLKAVIKIAEKLK